MARPALLDGDHRARSRDDEFARLLARNDQLEAENEALRCERERLRARIAKLER